MDLLTSPLLLVKAYYNYSSIAYPSSAVFSY